MTASPYTRGWTEHELTTGSRSGPGHPEPDDHDIVHELYGLPRFTERPGLHRIRQLLDPDGWWSSIDAVKVTGSNGKGTVATLTAAILSEHGLRVGLYTSPHLRRFSERIRIDGVPVSSTRLADAMAWLRPRLSTPEPPLAFEAMTALALRVFELEKVDVVVAEAGIGGRHDATRILPGSVNVLVSVDLEHTAILGETLEVIALDKADLAADDSLLLVGELEDQVRRGVEASAQRRGVRVEAPRDLPMLSDLKAAHQRRNITLAITAADRWLSHNRPGAGVRLPFAERVCRRVRLPGRLEKVRESPETWIDIAHSPAALRAVAEAQERPLIVVFGLSEDKEERARAMVEAVAGCAAFFICTQAAHRTGRAEVSAAAARQTGWPVDCRPDLAEALAVATAKATREGLGILVTGGLFVAIEAAEILADRDPGRLRFY